MRRVKKLLGLFVPVLAILAMAALAAGTAAAGPMYWLGGSSGGGTGSWDFISSQWSASDGGALATWGDYSDTYFGGTAGGTVTISGFTPNLNSLNFGVGVTGISGYVVTGGSLMLSTGNVAVASGLSETVNASIGGAAGLALNGGGTLILSGNNTYTGTTTVGAGTTLQVDSYGGAINSGNVTIIGNTDAGTLNITNGGTVANTLGYVGYASGSAGQVNVSGASKWTNSGALNCGGSGSGQVNILGGSTLTSAAANIGNSIAGGTVTVDGAGSTWSVATASRFTIGGGGGGWLNITNGASVTGGSETLVGYGGTVTGIVTVDHATLTVGAGSTDFYVGGNHSTGGHGIVYIQNGGTVNCGRCFIDRNSTGATGVVQVTDPGSVFKISSDFEIAFGSAGAGTVTVANGGAVLNSGTMEVGLSGGGTLRIINGGSVTNTSATIGNSVASMVTVDGGTAATNTTRWINSSTLTVGNSTVGTLHIANGGYVSDTTGYVAYNSGASGSLATVDGANSIWTNSGSLTVGYSGAGSVTQTGGTVSAGGTLYLGYSATGSGTYNLNGGVLALSALSAGSGLAAFNFGGGTLQASAPFSSSLPLTLTGTGGTGTVDTQSYDVALSGVLTGSGGLTKAGGTGTLTLSGANNYIGLTTVSAGTLTLVGQDALAAPGAWNPVLNLGGADITGGQLVFNYAGGSDPASTIAGLLGSKIYTTATGEKVSLTDDTVNDNVVLALVAALFPGDANGDGKVNGADLNAVLSNYNRTGMDWSQGDFNSDGTVNGADLNTVLSNYNRTAGATTAVPEPSTLALIAIGGIGPLACVWCRRGTPITFRKST